MHGGRRRRCWDCPAPGQESDILDIRLGVPRSLSTPSTPIWAYMSVCAARAGPLALPCALKTIWVVGESGTCTALSRGGAVGASLRWEVTVRPENAVECVLGCGSADERMCRFVSGTSSRCSRLHTLRSDDPTPTLMQARRHSHRTRYVTSSAQGGACRAGGFAPPQVRDRHILETREGAPTP